MKEVSEKLKEYRHEKIKMKGLSDFQNQIDSCIKEQKEMESYIVGLSILQASTHCSEIVSEQSEIEKSLLKTNRDRASCL